MDMKTAEDRGLKSLDTNLRILYRLTQRGLDPTPVLSGITK
jgi:hypothetical protein